MEKTTVISVEELARRFGRSNRWAAALMRRMRHVGTQAHNMYTTEEWLAEWLAAKSVPQMNWPRSNYDPLEDVVCSRVIQAIGDLAKAGRIQVVAV